MNYIAATDGAWQDSEMICALADTDRHLGHLIKLEHWYAYDATRADEHLQNFRCLGAFSDLASAKQILELAVWRPDDSRMAFVN